MKVTFCFHDRPYYVGGPNAGLRRLLPDLRERGVEVRALALMFGDPTQCPTICHLRKMGIPVTITHYQKTTEERVRWLLAMLRQDPPDIFVPNLMVSAYFASRFVREAGIPSVGVIRSSDQFHLEFIETFGNSRPVDRQDAFVCVSDYMREKTRNLAPDVPEVVQICSSADLSEQTTSYDGTGPFQMAYSGQIVEFPKNISRIIRAFARAAREIPGVEGYIYGHGKDWESAMQTYRECAEDVPVTMVGRVDSDDLANRLHQHHTITLFSHHEGLPLALLEGMSAGLVPVCTPTESGIPELVRPGETGIIVKDWEDEFVAAIRSLKENPDQWSTLSRGARNLVQSGYHRGACADKWVALFSKLDGSLGPKKRIRIPWDLDLPAAGCICREDDRAEPVQAFMAAARSFTGGHKAMDDGTNRFLRPACIPANIDRYINRRSILRALRESLPRMRGNIIDIGAGYAPYRDFFRENPAITSYLTADLKGGLYEHSSPPDIPWDGNTLPVEDGAADVVILTEVLEHCDEPAKTLAECSRVLAPGGLMFLTVPFLWPLHDVPYDAFRYTPWTLSRLLKEAGFREPDIKALGGYEAALGQMLGLFIRRRSRNPNYKKWIMPALSVMAIPVISALAKMDKPPEKFLEGQMVTGLWCLAEKESE